jgi:hypothetical protein
MHHMLRPNSFVDEEMTWGASLGHGADSGPVAESAPQVEGPAQAPSGDVFQGLYDHQVGGAQEAAGGPAVEAFSQPENANAEAVDWVRDQLSKTSVDDVEAALAKPGVVERHMQNYLDLSQQIRDLGGVVPTLQQLRGLPRMYHAELKPYISALKSYKRSPAGQQGVGAPPPPPWVPQPAQTPNPEVDENGDPLLWIAPWATPPAQGPGGA